MASAPVSVSGIPEPLSGKYVESFAYVTVKDRLPVILTQVVDFLCREKHAIGAHLGEKAKNETKQVIGRLSQLRNEMVTNKAILPLESNGCDVSLWNAYLEKQKSLYGFQPTWFDSPWLYVECYLYRRINESFELSNTLQSYDPFRLQKEEAFISSLNMAIILGSALQDVISALRVNENKMDLYEQFTKFVEMSLWGNKCDLSISAGTNEKSSASSFSQLDNLRDDIIVNEMEILWNMLQSANHKHPGSVRLDLVLDNAGFELFTDLCLLNFLDAAGLVSEVHLYVKILPWFVSDTLTTDVEWLLSTLTKHNEEILSSLGKKWREKFESKKWMIEEEMFWTLPHDYSEMEEADPILHGSLSQSHLIIFKGDLNYRKLTSDRQWPVDTPFTTALRGFSPAPLCTLRTIKCDLITGLNVSKKEELDKASANWMISGKYAVIQCMPLEQ